MGKAKVNYNTMNHSWIEPYIGWEFPIIKKGKSVSWIEVWGVKKKVDNWYLDFDPS